MASVQFYVEDAEHLIDEILTRTTHAQQNHTKYRAAEIIQSHYRGYRLRKHLKYLNYCATILQKYIRGFLVRSHLPIYYRIHIIDCAFQQYTRAAILIQSAWRSYYARSCAPNSFSYYKFKHWLNHVQCKNQQMKEQMALMRQESLEYHWKKIETESQQWVMFILFKLHHLLSTTITKGVLAQDILKNNSIRVEELIRSLKYSDYMKQIRTIYKKMKKKQVPRKIILRDRLARCERYWNEKNLDEYHDPVTTYRESHETASKPFILSAKFYTHDTYILGPYEEPIREIVRDINPAKNIDRNNLKPFTPHLDYYVNLWDHLVLCEEHFIPNPYEAGPTKFTLKNSQPRYYSVTRCIE